jgi:rSAM/selenodomain-associated transferase 2
MEISIIIPALNEAATIVPTLRALASVRDAQCEIIVVDGGSSDATASLAARHADTVIQAPPGRASQMNAGAVAASGDVLLFLHADTRLPSGAMQQIRSGLAEHGRAWGRFDVKIDGGPALLGLIALLMNMRSRATGIATGDQAIFVKRASFFAVGAFPDQPLMEDIEISRRLKAHSKPLCLRAKVTTSGRRWERRGVWRTIFLMWRLRLQYWLGTPPEKLARAYR